MTRFFLWVVVVLLCGAAWGLTGTWAALAVFSASVLLPCVSVALTACARRVTFGLYLPMDPQKARSPMMAGNKEQHNRCLWRGCVRNRSDKPTDRRKQYPAN